MPKISAPTVAEHRENQHQQVLDSALRYIVANEGQVPTVGDVAKEVGLARSSVYQYVSSRADIVAQLLVALMEEWAEAVDAAMNAADDDVSDKLSAYVRTTLELFTDGTRHAMMVAASNEPSVFADAKVMCAHNKMRPVLIDLLKKAGMPEGEAEAYSQLVDSSTHRAAEMIAQGSDRDSVVAALDSMVRLSD